MSSGDLSLTIVTVAVIVAFAAVRITRIITRRESQTTWHVETEDEQR